MLKKISYIFLLLLLVCSLSGCVKKDGDGTGYYVYYTNKERTGLARENYTAKETESGKIIGELLKKMQTPSSEDHTSAFLKEVEIMKYILTDGQLTITFHEVYKQMDNVTEVLLRAAIVKTVSQIKGVRTVVFHIGDDVLRDSAGEPVGAMTESQFINNPVGINSYQYAALSLYFSNAEGTKIVKEMRNVHYSSNTTIEKVVMEQLQKGPMSEHLLAVLPSGTKVLEMSIEQNMCTINFNETFMNGTVEKPVLPEVTVYSIVNSLCDMLGVERVQFQVEGESDYLYAGSLSLNGPFHRNSDIIEKTENQEVEERIFEEPSIGL